MKRLETNDENSLILGSDPRYPQVYLEVSRSALTPPASYLLLNSIDPIHSKYVASDKIDRDVRRDVVW